jgi:hypothetical protein
VQLRCMCIRTYSTGTQLPVDQSIAAGTEMPKKKKLPKLKGAAIRNDPTSTLLPCEKKRRFIALREMETGGVCVCVFDTTAGQLIDPTQIDRALLLPDTSLRLARFTI